MNIHRRPHPWLLAVALVACASAAPAQVPCPPPSGAASAAGWRAYRAGTIDSAAAHFTYALALCAANLDARTGLGFVALRRGAPRTADSILSGVVRADSANADAWTGLALARERTGDRQGAATAARQAMALNPSDETGRAVLDRVTPGWDRPPMAAIHRPDSLELPARVSGARFEIPGPAGWQPLWLKGVNMGVALPGKFPSEFPRDSAQYAEWFGLIAGAHANTIRVYTIMPPEFYRALRGWNGGHPGRELWLVHGVWTELPDDDHFDDPAFAAGFHDEMHRVVDLLHGHAELPARPGHASGRYDADVSRWTIAFVIGREWEPYAVKAFDARHPGRAPYRGRFLVSDSAPAMDRWMAEQCDTMLAYEFDRWHTLRPIAYTNWPTLDPLTHPTESNADEELRWRRRSGRQAEGARLEYENDAIGLDANLIRPSAANPAGWFASYHAYPYYPDFLLYDPGYNQARSPEGPSNYYGYLRDLVRHHHGMPVLIAEYGVPSSRGVAHLQPQGWNHGGHDEVAMGRIDARLTRDIHASGAAGALLFAWIDEWFKKNWVVTDFEIPGERNRLWLNAMDAEQNYGLLGMYAGDSATTPSLGGPARRWEALPEVAQASGNIRSLRVGSDAAYVYLAIETAAGFDWHRQGLEVGIDTWRDSVGQHLLPRSGVRSRLGFEFLLDLPDTAHGQMRVLPEYNRYMPLTDSATGDDYGRFYHRPVTVLNRDDGRFDRMWVITNRSRFGRDGTFFPAREVDRGTLRYGTGAASSLNDWYIDQAAGLVEVRIPWDLLNVTDPSSRTLLFERTASGEFGTVAAGDMHFMVAAYPKSGGRTEVLGPSRGWYWPGWEAPTWFSRLKPAYDSLSATWGAMR